MSRPRIILGVGTGRCGTRSLANLLNLQPGASVTHEEPPRLPWKVPDDDAICRRLSAMQQTRQAAVVGDVASYFLPYVEGAIEYSPDVRIVCLKRPRAEVVRSFMAWDDSVHPLPTNHWARRPPAGVFHHPIWSRIFPHYDVQDREEGIGRYWDEYFERAENLQKRFPGHFRIFPWLDALNLKSGQRAMLEFCGFRAGNCVLKLDIHKNKGDQAPVREAPALQSSDVNDPRRCIVLVPFTAALAARCIEALQTLEKCGYCVRLQRVQESLDLTRNQMLTAALVAGYRETLWVDPQVTFDPDDVDRLRSKQLPIACAVPPKAHEEAKDGREIELPAAALRLLHVRREVYERLQCDLELPVCDEASRTPSVPFFQAAVDNEFGGPRFVTADRMFAQRARQCGFQIVGDPSIRLEAVAAGAAVLQPTSERAAATAFESRHPASDVVASEKHAEPRVLQKSAGTCPPEQCAILVPVGDRVEPSCEASLRELERRGYRVSRVHGYKQIDLARCQMASDALAAGFQETFWIDADTSFHPDMVDRLRSHDEPIVCGIYPKKSKRELAIHAMPGTQDILFGHGGGLLEILYAPTGFLLVRRQVYQKMREQLQLPICRADTGRTLVPYYSPLVRPDGEGWWYLADDFAFCERARQCGYKVMADTSIRLLHIGNYFYGWEDAGRRVARYARYKFHLADAVPKE